MRLSSGARSTTLVVALLTMSFIAACGSENALVGGRCRTGMILEGDTCIAVPSSVASATPPTTDGAPITPDGDAGDAGGAADAEPSTDATPPFGSDASAILPPDPTLVVDAAPPGTSCTPPLVTCHGKCIRVDNDPANCGACGKICPSNICINSECQGATPGDVVVIGHDYTDANPGSAQAKVLVNALSIPTTDPIRILSYEDGASDGAVAQLKYLAMNGISRSIAFTRAASASALTSTTLGRNYDIVIINDASAVDPAVVGPQWQGPLQTFGMKGGVIVAIDSGDSDMPGLLSDAGLLPVGGHTLLPMGSHLLVSTASDVVGAGVLSPYAAFGLPVSFQSVTAPSADISWVVRMEQSDGTPGDPVVIHRTVR